MKLLGLPLRRSEIFNSFKTLSIKILKEQNENLSKKMRLLLKHKHLKIVKILQPLLLMKQFKSGKK
jgi:hypothetical protein